MNATSSICIYPLSPTYLPLHRYLYYTSLFLSVVYPTPPPFIKGAFAYALTYSGTASLYAILIISQFTSTIINLDIFALWSVLAAASTLLVPLLAWNKNLNSSHGKSARSIVRIWGVWVTVGMVCALVVMVRTQRLVKTSPVDSMLEEICPTFAKAIKMEFKLRDPKTAEMGEYGQIFGPAYRVIINITPILTIIPLFFGFISCFITIMPARPKEPGDAWEGVCVSSSAGTFSAGSALRAAYLGIQRIVLILSPCFFIGVLALNEKFLLKSWIPVAEEMYEVGQWGLLAGLGLVSAAAVVNWVVGRMVGAVRDEVKGVDDGLGGGTEIIV